MADIFDDVAAAAKQKGTAPNDEGFVGIDLDGTLAHYDGWKGKTNIGEPIQPMVDRVKQMLSSGKKVKIFTARTADDQDGSAKAAIDQWTTKHIGQTLPVTHTKEPEMSHLYDDRAVQVEPNTGKILGKEPADPAAKPNFHPSTHNFSVSKWKQANPGGDHQAASKQAQDSGYQVVD